MLTSKEPLTLLFEQQNAQQVQATFSCISGTSDYVVEGHNVTGSCVVDGVMPIAVFNFSSML